jgi:hypothetical protein
MTAPSTQTIRRGDGPSPRSSNHAIVIRIHGDFSIQELGKALDGIRARHAVLIPEANSDDPEPSHFQIHEIKSGTEFTWQEIVKEELLNPFTAQQGPFARFILLRLENDLSDLVGVFHHGKCDGMSAVYVARDMMRLLGEPGSSLPAIPSQPDRADLIPRSVKEDPRVRRQVAWFLFKIRLGILQRRLRSWLVPAADQNGAELAAGSQRICILTETLTAEQTAALTARCKAEGTSVHSAICVAWLRAFAAQLEGRRSWTRSASSPVSMRGRLSIPETSGIYLSMAQTEVNCAPGRGFWETTREFKRELNAATTDENLFLFRLNIDAVFSQIPQRDLKHVLPILFDRPVDYDFSITNLGRVDVPAKAGRLEVQAFHNLVNTSEHERTVCVNTFDGRLTWNYLFRELKMDPARAGELMALVREELSRAIN